MEPTFNDPVDNTRKSYKLVYKPEAQTRFIKSAILQSFRNFNKFMFQETEHSMAPFTTDHLVIDCFRFMDSYGQNSGKIHPKQRNRHRVRVSLIPNEQSLI